MYGMVCRRSVTFFLTFHSDKTLTPPFPKSLFSPGDSISPFILNNYSSLRNCVLTLKDMGCTLCPTHDVQAGCYNVGCLSALCHSSVDSHLEKVESCVNTVLVQF